MMSGSGGKCLIALFLSFVAGVLFCLCASVFVINKYFDKPTDWSDTSVAQDVDSLITVSRSGEIDEKRLQIVDYVFGGGRFQKEGQVDFTSAALPSVSKGIVDKRYLSLSNLSGIDKLVMKMPGGVTSVVYLFRPRNNIRSTAVIYHQGHDGRDFFAGKDVIARLVQEGYPVAAFSLPLLGLNNTPVIQNRRFGKVRLTHHDMLRLVELEHGSGIQFFLEPIVRSVNFLKEEGFPKIAMIGISGGGWVTQLASAIDTRISFSFPVAASWPIFLRLDFKDWGDYEQVDLKLLDIANSLELYLLGAVGEGRKQIQVFNLNDPRYYGGRRFEHYEKVIRNRVSQLGEGEFQVVLDEEAQEHAISGFAVELFLKELTEPDHLSADKL